MVDGLLLARVRLVNIFWAVVFRFQNENVVCRRVLAARQMPTMRVVTFCDTLLTIGRLSLVCASTPRRIVEVAKVQQHSRQVRAREVG